MTASSCVLVDAHHDADRAQQPFRELEVLLGRGRTGRDRGRAEPDERGRVRHRPHHRAARRGGFDGCDRHAGRDREHERIARQRRERGGECGRDVAGFDRDDHDVGVGDRPRPARHDPNLGEAGFEVTAAFRVDLRDTDVVGVVAAVQQPADECRAHLPAPEQRDASHRREANALEKRPRPDDPGTKRVAGDRSARRVRPTRHATRRATRPEERSCPLRTSPNEAGPPAPRASRWRHGTTRRNHISRHFFTF